jgi:hypothetical protein
MKLHTPEHWTDDELVAHLYGVGPENGHAEQCSMCSARLANMRAARTSVEERASGEEVSAEFLHAQRRRIYAVLSRAARPLSPINVRRWASAATAVLVLAGGMLFYEQRSRQRPQLDEQTTDAQLALEVSHMAESAEAPATAPLQGLFD